jgi:hypothetical protein
VPRYAQWIREVYGTRARALGFNARKGESDEAKLLRAALLKVLGDAGEDPAVQAQARRLSDAWLVDHRAVDPELAPAALDVAAQKGDRAFFDRLHAAAGAEKDRRDRQIILGALGSFRDPALAGEAMRIALSDEFPARESGMLVFGPSRSAATRSLAWLFVRDNFDQLAGRMPRREAAGLVSVGSALCDEEKRPEVEAFFRDRLASLPGGPRKYTQAMESLRICAAFRARQAPAVARFFSEAHAAR